MKKVVCMLGLLALTSGMASAQDVNDPEPSIVTSTGYRSGLSATAARIRRDSVLCDGSGKAPIVRKNSSA